MKRSGLLEYYLSLEPGSPERVALLDQCDLLILPCRRDGDTFEFVTGSGEHTSIEGTFGDIKTLYQHVGIRALLADPATSMARAPEQLSKPPAFGEALIVLFCPKNRIEAVMGDLEERFTEELASKGERRARLLYWARVIRSIGPLLGVKIRRAGILAALFEIGRRWGDLS
jgi:hypothetical protein